MIAVVGIVPYIALQLKAISDHLQHPARPRARPRRERARTCRCWQDTALYVALLLAAFTILFGTRHLDAAERHEGMVAAIAFESVVKLVAFLAVGCYVTFVLFGGSGDLLDRAAGPPGRSPGCFTFEAAGGLRAHGCG